MIYLRLLIEFFQIGLFSIGGGYAMLPLIQEKVIEKNAWITMTEFADLLAISQMTPGPIGINAATFVGIKTAGLFGGFVATAGCILPSLLIVLILARLYSKYGNAPVIQGAFRGIRPVVVALIATAGISIINLAIFQGEKLSLQAADPAALVILIAAILVLRLKKPNILGVMIGSGLLGMIEYLLMIKF